jgi:WD40 repeat protein
MVRLIGCGSYGEVWLARTTVGTWRAVKVVFRDRFKDHHPYDREFAGIQKYEPISRSNEGLVDVLQIGRNEDQGYFYYVMELADDASGNVGNHESGDHRITPAPNKADLSPSNYIPHTLSLDLLRRGRLSLEECVTLGLKLNLALGHLHRNRLIHRDVKPPNIIFVNDVPKLADIGLVADLTGALSFVGTEGYVAPEGPNSPQADLYALGKVLYEASMGKDRQQFPELFAELDSDPDAKGLVELNAVLLRACASNPQHRYRTAEEMNADLALLHSGKSVQLKHAVERRVKITTRVAAAAVALMVLAVFPYYVAIREAGEARVAREAAEQAQAGEARERATAEGRLYDSLLGEARATRLARRVGYRDKVFALLKQANSLDVPQKNLADLRREAGACLGDFVGLMPTTFSGFPTNTTIRRALVDPTGQCAAFLLGDKTVILRQLPAGTEIGRFQLSGDWPTRSFCFNRTGDRLIFVRMPEAMRLEDRIPDACVNVWSRGEGNQWREVEDTPLAGAVDCLSTADGVFITAFAEKPRVGKLIDADTKAVVREFDYPEDWIPEVTLSPDGQLLVTEATESANSTEAVLDVLDLRTGRRIKRLAPRLGLLGSLGFSPDGKHLMCSSRTSGEIYEVGSFRSVAQFSARARVPLVFAPASGLVAMPVPRENRIRLRDWVRNEEVAVLDERQQANKVDFAPDGSFLLTVSLGDARLYRLDQTPEKLNLRHHLGNRPGVAISRDGLRVATVGLNPTVRVSDAANGREIWKSDTPPSQGHVAAYSHDGRWLATGDFDAGQVHIWNAHTGEPLRKVSPQAGGRLWSVQFSPDGRYLATASNIDRPNANGVELWAMGGRGPGELTNGLPPAPMKSVGSSAWSLTFSPDGRLLAYVDRDLPGVFVCGIEGQSAPRCLGTDLIRGIGNDQSLCFTPDSRRLLFVDRTRAVVTLDVATGERVSTFATADPNDTGWTESAGLSLNSDGNKLAMISASGRGVDVWVPQTGQLLYSLPEQNDTVYWLAWSHDSERLVISTSSGDTAVWNLNEVEQILASLD